MLGLALVDPCLVEMAFVPRAELLPVAVENVVRPRPARSVGTYHQMSITVCVTSTTHSLWTSGPFDRSGNRSPTQRNVSRVIDYSTAVYSERASDSQNCTPAAAVETTVLLLQSPHLAARDVPLVGDDLQVAQGEILR
jgi:hypothetical protein